MTGSYDNMVRLWNKSGECVATVSGHSDSVKSVAFGPSNGKIFLPFFYVKLEKNKGKSIN